MANKYRSKVRIFLLFFLMLPALMFGALMYFLMVNDAPVFSGEVVKRIEYKKDLMLDIYLPTQALYVKSPVVVYVHGGAWIIGSKLMLNSNRFNEAFNTLREAGYAIVSTNYTLADRTPQLFPICIADVKDAINWLKINASVYHLDTMNIGLFGESAGANIALMIAYGNKGNSTTSTSNENKIRYVVDIYGPTDLNKMYYMDSAYSLSGEVQNFPERIRNWFDISQYILGFDPQEDSIRTVNYLNDFTPLHYVSSNVPPTLIIHGEADQIVPVQQSFVLHTALDSFNVQNEFHVLKDVNHAFIGANSAQKDSIQNWVVDFIFDHYYP